MEHSADEPAVKPDEMTVPVYAADIFGERLDVAEHFAHLLATTGVTHGLIGPREIPRLWDRHVGNCGVVHTLLPPEGTVIDVGSGAGLPGIALAIASPHLSFVLIEPLLRRTRWLESAVLELQLSNVEVLRGKAQAFHGELQADVVTSRAVAHLSDLILWCAPLVKPSGRLIALKGERAHQEILDASPALRDYGASEVDVLTAHVPGLEPATQVVSMRFNSTGTRRKLRSSTGAKKRMKNAPKLSASRLVAQHSRLPSGSGTDSEGADRRG